LIKRGPRQRETKSRASLGISGDPRRIVIGSAGNEAGAEQAKEVT
jgi:hypothetical protein